MSKSKQRALVDKLLTDVSNGYFPEGYISEDALPMIKVKQMSGILGGYGNNHLRLVNTLVGGKGKASRFEPIAVKTDNFYKVENHALEGNIDEDTFDNFEEPFDAESDETEGLTHAIWLGKENALASLMTDPAIITQNTTLVGTQQFNDYDNSKPLEVVREARTTVWAGCFNMPNRCIMARDIAETLAYHPQVLRQLGFSDNRAGTLTDDDIKRFLKVDMLHIGNVFANFAAEGQADDMRSLWGKDMVLYYAPKVAKKRQKSFGYYIKMRKRTEREVFKQPTFNPPNGMDILVRDSYSFHLADAKCAYLIIDAIA